MKPKFLLVSIFILFHSISGFSQLPETPEIPEAVNQCGYTILYRKAAPAQTTWYWQGTNPDGTDMSNSNPTYTATTSGAYYIRAYNSNGWSENSASVDITIINNPATPTVADYTIEENCGNTVITKNTAPAGQSFYFQYAANETNTQDYSAQNSLTIYSEQDIFLRSRYNDMPNCWSDALTINHFTSMPQIAVANAPTDVTENSFTANWDAVPGATKYYIDVSSDSDFSTLLTGYDNLDIGNVLSTPVTGLAGNTQYFYRIRAFNGTCASDNSNTQPARTLLDCPPESQIYIYGNGYIIPSGNTIPDYVQNTFFGNVELGQTKTKTFTIFNKGNSNLILNGSPHVTISGADAGQFSVSTQPITPIIEDGSVNFELTFSPTYVKPGNERIECVVTVQSNDPHTPDYTFTIGGFGVDNTVGPANMEGDFSGTWEKNNTGNHRGLVRAFYEQAATSGNKNFLFNLIPNDYDPKWGGGPINANVYNEGGAVLGASDLIINTNANYHYTAIISLDEAGDNNLNVLETSYLPNEIDIVERTPDGIIYPNDEVTISVQLSGNRNTDEYFFVRWTNDGWATSYLSEINVPVGGTTGTATIPAQLEGTVVDFYALSTQSADPEISNIDYFSLRINNSDNNSNYEYIVKSLPEVNASTPNIIQEGFENGSVVLVEITKGIFKTPFNPAEWSIPNLPAGVTIDHIIEGCRANQAYIILSGNTTIDYDVQIDSYVIVSSDAVEGLGYSSDITSNQEISLEPVVESVTISSDICLSNGNLNNAIVELTIENDFFIENNLQASSFILNNAPSGLTIANVSYIDKQTAILRLSMSSIFSNDYSFSVTVSENVLFSTLDLTSNTIDVFDMPIPGLSYGHICGEGQVNFLASNTEGNDVQFSYDGVNPDYIVSSPYQFATYTLTAGSEIEVFARNISLEGCVSTWIGVSVRSNIIPSEPIISDELICGAQDYTIEAIIGNEGNAVDFSLDGTNVSGSDNSSPYEFTTQITENSTVTIYASTTNESNHCSSSWVSAQITSELAQAPSSVTADETEICNGSSVTLSYTGGAGDTFNWYSDACGGTLIGTGNNFTVTPTTTTTYYGAWENLNCGISECQSITINVNDNPSNPTSVDASDTEICEGENITLSFEGGSGETFQWFDDFCDGSLIGTGNDLTVTPTSTTTYYGAWTNVCGVSECQSITITVNENPTAPTIVDAIDTEICSGESVTLSYEGGSGTTFNWYSDNCGGTIIGTGNDLNVSPTTTTTYYGAWINDCGISDCQSVTITVDDSPTSPTSVSANETEICEGENITLSYEGGSGTTFNWYNDNCGGTIVGTGNNLTVTPTSTTTYYGAWITECGVSDCQSITVEVIDNPTPPNTVSASETEICSGDNITLTYDGGDGITFNWYSDNCDGTLIGTGNELTISPPTTTTYYGTWENVCGVSDCQDITVTVNEINLTDIETEGSFIYLGEDGTITLLESENGLNYQFYLLLESDSTDVGAELGTGNEIIHYVVAEYLSVGDNQVKVFVTNGQCKEYIGLDVINVISDLIIPDGFSPNDNGINDDFIIEGIEEYPNNNVKIYNRWGTLVFEANGYDNAETVWDGKASRGLKIGDDPLPEGTYFFIIDLKNGTVVRSSVYLKR